MANSLNQSTVDHCLSVLDRYRVRRVQTFALQGAPDGISGALLLAWGLRESNLQNIVGGLMKAPDGSWVPQTDPALQDVGVWQISRHWNGVALRGMAAVPEGEWGPIIPGRTAYDEGCCPQFETQMRFTLALAHDHMAMAADAGATTEELQVRVALAAHNCGFGGALRGLREMDVDKYTTQGDYSAWVLAHRTKVNHALHSDRFKNWLVA
jgi:hypothetical protein